MFDASAVRTGACGFVKLVPAAVKLGSALACVFKYDQSNAHFGNPELDPEILAHDLHLLVSQMLPRLIRVMRLLSVPGRLSREAQRAVPT